MSPEEIKVWLAIGGSVGGLAFGLYNFFRQPSRDNSNKIEEQSDEIQEISRRVDHIETQLEHMPTKDDFNSMQLDMRDLIGKMGVTEEIVKTTRRSTQTIEDWIRAKDL